jgi:glutamine synthetase
MLRAISSAGCSIAPDANPYLAIYTIFKTGLEGPISSSGDGAKYLSDTIYDAIRLHQGSAREER